MTIDTITLHAFQQIQNPILTSFFKTVGTITEPIILAIVAIIISATLFFKNKKKSIFFASTIIITSLLIKSLKQIIQRPRPLTALIQENSFALPSGHTTMSIVFFGLLVYLFTGKKKKLPLTVSIIIVTTICLSRLYLQVHWLTDIIAGIVLGTIILITSITTYKKI